MYESEKGSLFRSTVEVVRAFCSSLTLAVEPRLILLVLTAETNKADNKKCLKVISLQYTAILVTTIQVAEASKVILFPS